MKKTSPYSILARYYDDFAGKKRYSEWESLLKNAIKKYDIARDFAVDLACGTGTNSQTLKKIGFEKVFGIDKSRAMLAQAKEKHKGITFFQKNFLNFIGSKFTNISLVTCFYDSLNYLLDEAQLKIAFLNVYNNLNAGGVFIFDLNTTDHLKGISGNKPAIFEKDGLLLKMESTCHGKFWYLDLHISTNNGKNIFKERHVEKAYDEGTVKKLLKSSGFKILDIIREQKEYQDGKIYNNRIYYIVKK